MDSKKQLTKIIQLSAKWMLLLLFVVSTNLISYPAQAAPQSTNIRIAKHCKYLEIYVEAVGQVKIVIQHPRPRFDFAINPRPRNRTIYILDFGGGTSWNYKFRYYPYNSRLHTYYSNVGVEGDTYRVSTRCINEA